MRAARLWLLGIVGVVHPAGCSRHYDAALRDIALSPDQRLASRVAGMEESARGAIQALEAAARAVWASGRGGGGDVVPPTPARRARLINDADAAVFEYSRRVLIVRDVSPGAGEKLAAYVEPLHASMTTAQESLVIAMSALRGRGAAGSSEAHPNPSFDPGALAAGLEQAKADVEAMSRQAKLIIDAAGPAGR